MFRTISTKFYHNRPAFVDDVTKKIRLCFWVRSSNCCSLTKWNAKFHKVVWRHYSGELKNVYITVSQIYSGLCVPNFIRIDWVLWMI